MPIYRKKPVEIEAVQLQASRKSVLEVYKFIHGEDSVNLSCRMAEDRWDDYADSILREGLKLKTPESDGETQVASVGDYIVKGWSEKLGTHFWPVKPDYFESAYDKV